MSEFTCAKCHNTFQKTNNTEWNEFKAAEEYLILMPEAKNDSTDILCDDCYKEFRKWFDQLTDEMKNKMRNEHE